MADYSDELKRLLTAAGCYFRRPGKGIRRRAPAIPVVIDCGENAFWKSRLDPRWFPIIDKYQINVLDLDEVHDLFRMREGQSELPREALAGFDDGFLLGR